MAAACASNDEFWKECTTWLIQWGILRIDHRANLPNATIGDLANTLRDGVLLCTLLSKIDPQCIDLKQVNQKPAFARFLCLRNIQLFLNVCKTFFHLSDHDLFEQTMLFDLNDFYKVLCTLSKLSMTSQASEKLSGFYTQTTKCRDEKEIYQCLQSNEPPIYDALNTKYNAFCDHNCEDTYQTIIQDKIGCAPIDETYEKRDHVIKELVDTEQNYVEVLTKLKKNFYVKLTNVIPPDHLDVIFFKILDLCDIHQQFLELLHKLDKGARLSTIFINKREAFLIYGAYCANLSNACAQLQELCEKNQDICNKVQELEKQDNNGKFKLRDVLSVPMQRILKYHLLLQKLVEYTDPKHEEYKDLNRASECMIDVNGYINEYARDSEQLTVIRQIRENIVNWDCPINLEQCGRLVKDGELKIKPHDDGKVRTRYVFIFQKYMILCKSQKDGKFTYRDMLPLGELQIDDYNNRAVLNQNARWSYQWVLFKAGQTTAFTCSVRSPQMKEQMTKALKECIDNLNPPANAKSQHKYEMHTFDRPTVCSYCSKYLKGLIFQGYRCKDCSSSVHKECILQSGSCGTPPVTVHPRHSTSSVHTDDELSDKLWFVGDMNREVASAKLQHRPNGTYLVRIRPESEKNVRYALSLKTENTVKHMKICATDDGPSLKYFLSTAKYFNSIEKLVENYQEFSLKESFERLQDNTKLEFPFKNIRAVAARDFEAQDDLQLTLRQGQEVIVYRQEGYRDGWWMGSCHNNGKSRSGFFPSQYIKILETLHAH